jgi:hypothetical protein
MLVTLNVTACISVPTITLSTIRELRYTCATPPLPSRELDLVAIQVSGATGKIQSRVASINCSSILWGKTPPWPVRIVDPNYEMKAVATN